MFMMNKNIVTNLQYHRVLVMWKMILLALLLLTVSCKSQKTITRNIASQTIICGKCQGSGEERFCPKCAGTGQVIPNSKRVQTGLLESVPYVMVVDEHLFVLVSYVMEQEKFQ